MLRFVDASIVHDDYRVAAREGVHVIEETFNEFIEQGGSVERG